MKTATFICGIDGVGKSGFAGLLKEQRSDLGIIIDVDKITAELGGNTIAGGKVALKKIRDCIDKGISFPQEGQKVTKIAKGTQETVMLIAHFDPITYTVAYNGGGGKGSMGKVTVTYDQEQTVAENGFTRPGYTFTGWNTAKNGKGTAYKPGDTLRNLTTKQKGTVTLYAQWEQSK